MALILSMEENEEARLRREKSLAKLQPRLRAWPAKKRTLFYNLFYSNDTLNSFPALVHAPILKVLFFRDNADLR